ncbi:MAG: hypothetical protein JJ913_02850 [Rhizobiaceae bacterium]|nr:hypothetical protein [Rhizobiaceae bacterium]
MGKGTGSSGVSGRLAILLAVAFALAGCAGPKIYFAEEDAPAYAKAGETGPLLALTQTFGGALSPVVRNLAAPHGELIYREGLAEFVRSELRPLDIVLVRSRPALTRALITSHFTHAIVWLGTEDEMRRAGVLSLPEVAPYHDALAKGRTVLESAGDNVRLSPFSEMIDVDEIVILRVRDRGAAWRRARYSALFAHLGTPFDYNFDFRDRSRLTCAELVAEVFPEFGIPVRFTRGRYAIIPDDIARLAVDGSRHLSVRRYIWPDSPETFATGVSNDVRSVLTVPQPAG